MKICVSYFRKYSRANFYIPFFKLTTLWLGGYYVVGGAIFIFSNVGHKLSLITEDRSHKALINIFDQQPRHVWIMTDGVEVEIPFEELQVGDTLLISAGQMMAADGIIVEGNGIGADRALA